MEIIQIEEKEKTKKRLGHSPDRADAVLLSFAQVNIIEIPKLTFPGATKKPAWK